MTRVVVPAARLGEGPVWDAAASRLHWVDILAGKIHTTALDTGATSTLVLPTLVGAVAQCRSGGFVAATAEGFAHVSPNGVLSTRQHILAGSMRMNDGKCDSRGRFWAGSTDRQFAPGQGSVHVLFPGWHTVVALTGLTLPNGMGWSPDDKTFYLVDTLQRVLLAYEFDADEATLSHRRVLARFDEADGLADGMTVDAEGCLWIAMWGGGHVRRLSPDGDLIRTVPVPVRQPSSCTFAGQHLDLLCVTSAREGLTLHPDDLDGALFELAIPNAKGLPQAGFAGCPSPC